MGIICDTCGRDIDALEWLKAEYDDGTVEWEER